jgi:hypothetical protein
VDRKPHQLSQGIFPAHVSEPPARPSGAGRAGGSASRSGFPAERDDSGRRLVVRNGYHQSREVLSSAGAVQVTAPRVNDKRIDPDTGERKRFNSAILPAWARKTPKVTEVLPLLYLHGLSSGGLRARPGPVPRLISRPVRAGDYEADGAMAGRAARVRRPRPVAGRLRVRVGRRDPREHPAGRAQAVPAGDDRVRADGRKELITLADGYRESAESWADLLRDAARRGMRAPLLAAGDGALGFWGALREVFPATAEQRCWFRKTANVLALAVTGAVIQAVSLADVATNWEQCKR